jgi:hypothetical protein
MPVSMPYCPFPGIPCAVSPDMDKLLAAVTPCETSLAYVRLYPDSNMAKARQFEYLTGL